MNPPNANGWSSSSGPGVPSTHAEFHPQSQPRALGSFGPNQPMQQGPPPPQIGVPVLPPPPPAPYYANQAGGHALPALAGLAQASPLQAPRPQPPSQSQQQQQSPPVVHHHQAQIPPTSSQASTYALPTLGQAMQQQSPHGPLSGEREREYPREPDARELEERQRHHEVLLQREHERERELREQQQQQQQLQQLQQQREQQQREQIQREQQQHQQQQQLEQQQPPLETHTGSIPLQQPVASRISTSLHGPNGLLNHSNTGGSTGAAPNPLTAPVGPPGTFGNGTQVQPDSTGRQLLQQPGPNFTQPQMVNFGGAMTPQQLQGGMAALSQGQQPILNDALSYLDQVKVRFVEQPEVYNKFLDIMKDFKSQAIDTPGVIERVSTLFNGHPHLIQGFNTFLPPGYKIECGTRDDPNSIRVTTPMGTTVSQLNGRPFQVNGGPNGINQDDTSSRLGFGENENRGYEGNWQHNMNVDNAVEGQYSPRSRAGAMQMVAQDTGARQMTETQYPVRDEEAADAALLQERGVSQLQNAVQAATNGIHGRQSVMQISPSEGPTATLGQAVAGLQNGAVGLTPGGGMGLEKRGPVEFNHAISYVNKIKNRFASQPEIYKQFLEILQTYQRESKPIQDVYAQVTQLFNSAPDLLEDFKQFLPESAAQAKAQAAARQATEDAAMLSNVRGEPGYTQSMQMSQTPRPETKMPPIGNFAPPTSVTKESKKRRGGPGSQITGGASSNGVATESANFQGNRTTTLQGGNANKRARVQQVKATGPEPPLLSPTLIPDLPQPLPPSNNASGGNDEIAFFDRVRKFIANKQTFNEFLKLCNLFTQDLIDKNILVHKAQSFIGSNADLYKWFKTWIQYDGRDQIVENKPLQSEEKVVLSNCRALGPSYRLLPKRERQRKCSGRDELCNRVLNDEWASHPTWASEDSGFIAHRKNMFEESLHRIEEERHDYDFNIETCLRTIQLLDPLVQQIKHMTDEERPGFKLPPGLGGQSEAIYQRVIKKIYDRDRGQKVIDDMQEKPATVCPILLGRLKQKVEEWKGSQREWEKVWRDQTHKQFWRSLDHQGLNARSENKRQFQPKSLQTEIQTKYEEQRRQRILSWSNVPKYQFQYDFAEEEVIYDASHILLTYLQNIQSANGVDRVKIETFFKTFIPTFFGLDRDVFQRRMSDVYTASPPNEEVDDDQPANEDSPGSRGRRAVNGKKGNLLRGVLDRSQQGKTSRKDKEGSAAAESKETTPDITSMDEDSAVANDLSSRADAHDHRWMEHPSNGSGPNRQQIRHNEPYARDTFNLYGNVNIYCFVRMFEMLFSRLARLKQNEQEVHEDVRRAKAFKPAIELKMIDRQPMDYWYDTSSNADYYQQVVRICEDVVKGEMDMNHLEETLRRFYLQHGWQLFNFDKMLAAIVRFATQILVSDTKDKSSDIINLFYKNRKENETTHQAELDYRKQVEKLAKDSDIYRIAVTQPSRSVTIQIFKRDDKTFDIDEMSAETRWSYYISSYVMRDWTEGVPHNIQWPFLRRNLPSKLDTEEEYNAAYMPQSNEDGLVIRIRPGDYRILYDPGTSDGFVHGAKVTRRGFKGATEVKEDRKNKFQERFEKNSVWMEGMAKAEVDKINADFKSWIGGSYEIEAEGDANRKGQGEKTQDITAASEPPTVTDAGDEAMTGT